MMARIMRQRAAAERRVRRQDMGHRAFLFFTVITVIGLAACATDIQPDPVYRETEIRQARPRLAGEQFDPQESDPALRSAFSAADQKAERAVGNVPRDSTFIVHFWNAKKRILSKEYGISWKTPAEMNPQIRYLSYGQPEVTELEKQSLREKMSERLAPGETVHGMLREFDGIVLVSTHNAATDTSKLYRFTGHDQSWTFLDEGVIEE
jgi:hypothetical protein